MQQLDLGFACATYPQAKASRYGEQLTRAWAFLRERARSPEEAEALDQELERQLAEGPRYHRDSAFADVPRINYDRNFLAKVLFSRPWRCWRCS